MLRQYTRKFQLFWSGKGRFIFLRLETGDPVCPDIQYRTLDHRGIGEHQRDGLVLVNVALLGIRQLAKRGARLVEQGLPSQFRGPFPQLPFIDAGFLIVVKLIGYFLLFQPFAGLLDGIAIRDSKHG